MKRKWPFFSVTGMMYLLPTRTKAEATIRISMGLSILIHPNFDISMILTLWGHKLRMCFM
uniref:Uncharacterized protein n=1 Tax=Arundo donax TaxID=35708 RepID=A0A0A9C5P9_ARUDO